MKALIRSLVQKIAQNVHPDKVILFGSQAWGGADKESDVDLLVEFAETVDLFEFVRLKFFLEQVLHAQVDLVTEDALKKNMKDQILKEAIRAA